MKKKPSKNSALRIVFFGTPDFAASLLTFLLDAEVEIAAVVTQPDRPKGRSLQTSPPPVKFCLLERKLNIPIFQPEKASDPAFHEELKQISSDLFVVVAFGQILPQSLLDIPPKGCINVHASLLPKYRGAAPIQRSLLHGEKETGVAIQKMVKQLDAGDVIATAKVEILPNMTYGELEKELCELSKPLLLLVLQAFEKGIPPAEPQNHSLATYASKVAMEEAEIQWEKSADEIHNQIRAFSPRPGAWCWQINPNGEKKRVKILRTEVVNESGSPGKIAPNGVVGCGSKSLKIIEIQLEGKKAMPASEWLRGARSLPHFHAERH
jgi:methionyl-tRNA formyltransferase